MHGKLLAKKDFVKVWPANEVFYIYVSMCKVETLHLALSAAIITERLSHWTVGSIVMSSHNHHVRH